MLCFFSRTSASNGLLLDSRGPGRKKGEREGGFTHLTVGRPEKCELVVDLLVGAAEPADVAELEGAPVFLEAQLYREAQVSALGGFGLG